jgi:hypothetical protein
MLARQQPSILLSEHKMIRNRLRSYKRGGVLLTGKLNADLRLRLRRIISEEPQGLLSSSSDFELIVDTGCTKTGTGFVEGFIPGTLTNLDRPIRMDGIAGGLAIKQEGKVRYEIIDDNGRVQEIIAEAYHPKHTSGNFCRKETIQTKNVRWLSNMINHQYNLQTIRTCQYIMTRPLTYQDSMHLRTLSVAPMLWQQWDVSPMTRIKI